MLQVVKPVLAYKFSKTMTFEREEDVGKPGDSANPCRKQVTAMQFACGFGGGVRCELLQPTGTDNRVIYHTGDEAAGRSHFEMGDRQTTCT